MATIDTAQLFFDDLVSAYPGKYRGPKEIPSRWRAFLNNVPEQHFHALLDTILEHQNTFPSLAQLRHAWRIMAVAPREESREERDARELRLGIVRSNDGVFSCSNQKMHLDELFAACPVGEEMALVREIAGLTDDESIVGRSLPYDAAVREEGVKTPAERTYYDQEN